LSDEPLFDQDCRASTGFYYHTEVDFFEFLENPDGLKERVLLEVIEQLNSMIKAIQERAITWQREKQAATPVNPNVTPGVEQ
jgi:hypothetical protein